MSAKIVFNLRLCGGCRGGANLVKRLVDFAQNKFARTVFQSILLLSVLVVSGCGGGGGGGTASSGGGSTVPIPINYFISNAPLNRSNGNNYDDAEYQKLGGLTVIGAATAYQRNYFGQGVMVAVVGSGLRTDHKEFAGRVVRGINAIDGSTNVPDIAAFGTGTQVAGVIAAAQGNTNLGISGDNLHGVAPQASIMPIKIFSTTGSATDIQVRNAIVAANNAGAKIFSNSYPGLNNILVGRLDTDLGPGSQLYRIEVPYAWGVYTDADGVQARGHAAAIRNRDMVMVWGVGDNGWQDQTGMIRAERVSCTELRENTNCRQPNNNVTLSYGMVVSNFVSIDYVNDDRDTIPGIGKILEKGFGAERFTNYVENVGVRDVHYGERGLSSYYASLPYWSIPGIAQLLKDIRKLGQDEEANLNSDGTFKSTSEMRRLQQEGARIQAEGTRLEQNPDFLALKLRWLAVAAVDKNNTIASDSNGCGYAETWCLSAPGYADQTTDNGNDLATAGGSGTHIAAAYVSGALAVLKSRLRSMPTYVASAVLLSTATKRFGIFVGTPGTTDGVYGHGILNLSAAIEYQGRVQLAATSATSAPASFNPQTSRVVLPASMAGVREQLQAAEVAFELPNGLYYNTPLSEFVEVQPSPKVDIGNAAADMLQGDNNGRTESGMFFADADSQGVLRHAGADINGGAFGAWRFRRDFVADDGGWQQWQDADAAAAPFFAGHDRFLLQMRGGGLRPFAAFGKSSEDSDSTYRQFGLRWRGGGERVALLAEASMIDEENYFMGADWRALGEVESRTWQGRVVLRGAPLWGWKSFIKAETASGDVDIKGNGFLRGASGLRADGYVAGLERELFGGDKLRLWAGRETSLRSGKLRLRYPQAEGDFASAFYGVRGQTIQMRESEVDLSGGSVPVFALGYAFRLSDGARAAFGAERRGGESAVSAALRVSF